MSKRTELLAQYVAERDKEWRAGLAPERAKLLEQIDSLQPTLDEYIACRRIETHNTSDTVEMHTTAGVFTFRGLTHGGTVETFFKPDNGGMWDGIAIARNGSNWCICDTETGKHRGRADIEELERLYNGLDTGLKSYFDDIDKKIGYTEPSKQREAPFGDFGDESNGLDLEK